VLLFIGLVIGVRSPSAAVTYLVALVAGMITGRLLYDRKHKLRAPYMLIIIGFVIGYVIGSFYGNRFLTFLLFLFGATGMYYLLNKKFIRDVFV